MASIKRIFNHIVVGALVLAVLPQKNVVMHVTGLMTVACIQAASTQNSIHRG